MAMQDLHEVGDEAVGWVFDVSDEQLFSVFAILLLLESEADAADFLGFLDGGLES